MGYMMGSFVVDRLRSLHVEEPYLKPYKTADFDGIFGKIPYLNLFLTKNGNCGKSKMVGAFYKTNGFGLVRIFLL